MTITTKSIVAVAALVSAATLTESPDARTASRQPASNGIRGARQVLTVARTESGETYIKGPCGWTGDPTIEREISASPRAYTATALVGAWERRKAAGHAYQLLFLHERQVLGANLPPQYQESGTCVSRGTAGAAEKSLAYQVATTNIHTRSVRIDFATIYAGSRVAVGKGQLGNSDGSFGGWAARWLSTNGLIPRGVYAGVDLTDERAAEQWAVRQGAPGKGVPDAVLKDAALRGDKVPVRSLLCDTPAEMADAVAYGCGCAVCTPVIWGDRNADGISKVAGQGGHCVECCGVFLDKRKRLGFVMRQSWGPGVPRGPLTLQTLAGPVEMPDGCYGVMAEELWKYCGPDQGVVWAFQLVRGFPTSDIGSILLGPAVSLVDAPSMYRTAHRRRYNDSQPSYTISP